MNKNGYTLDARLIQAIERVLNDGSRVELIPTKDGVRAKKVLRADIKTGESKQTDK